MPNEAMTRGALNRAAVRIHHQRPLIALVLGAAIAGVYLWVGDTLLLVPVAIAAYYAHMFAFRRQSMRHTALKACQRCAKLRDRGPIGHATNRMLTWYFHRRIVDAKAAMLLVVLGVVVTTVYSALGKPHAVLPFLAVYELYLVQFAAVFRSLVVHRANEASCRLCKAGDEMHPYGRVQASELED